MHFSDLGLIPQLLDTLAKQGYQQPSPVQEKAIPAILKGKDVMAAAQTGTGKTAGFTLPLLQNLNNKQNQRTSRGNQVRALILTPTRELAAQVEKSVQTYGKQLRLKYVVVFGGVKINPQMQRLRGGVDVLIATPGRLLDLHQQNAIKFNDLQVLVLDEADRMLDMGFIHDIRRITRLLPKNRQTLMFSATFSKEIRQLAKTMVQDPVEISIGQKNSTANSVKQKLIPVEKQQKAALLCHLLEQKNWFQVLVFTRTKHGANKLVKKLMANNINSAAIHGNKSQGARTRALEDFKRNKVRVLVATDIAARGIDINQLPHVVNFDLPNVAEDYVHRIGRTGRAGASGEALSLVSHDEFKQLQDIERLIKKHISREEISGFEPVNQLPVSRLQTNKRTANSNKKVSQNNSAATKASNNKSKIRKKRPAGLSKKARS